jgi:hypothetical protein
MKIYTTQIIQLNNLKDKKGEKQRDLVFFSLEGIFLMNQHIIYKLNVVDEEPVFIDDLIIDASTETREIVYQIPNIHLLVNTLSFSFCVNKKLGLSFVFEEKYDKNDKIGENYFFLAEKCDEQIKMCIYEFLSSLQ